MSDDHELLVKILRHVDTAIFMGFMLMVVMGYLVLRRNGRGS